MKIWHISDTHTKHKELDLSPLQENLDMIIHTGDAGTSRDISHNDGEIRDFLQWYSSLPVKYKLFIPGNHDTSIGQNLWKADKVLEEYDIHMLINKTIEIEGVKIFGSPYTPAFGFGWAFNSQRHKIQKHWNLIEEGTDIVAVHGPPKGMLDLNKEYISCGCGTLTYILGQIKPKYCLFGHIHEDGGKLLQDNKYPDTTFINGSAVNLMHDIINNGKIIEI